MIRHATENDAEAMLEIYRPCVLETAISFESEVPSNAEFKRRIREYSQITPWLVYEFEKQIAGYAYASKHRDRKAYQWSVDVSVYVHAQYRKQKIAHKLYDTLLNSLAEMGYYNAFAGIALPNEASVRLHESTGFRSIGVYKSVGYKLGRWHDVGWWQKTLREYTLSPGPVTPNTEC